MTHGFVTYQQRENALVVLTHRQHECRLAIRARSVDTHSSFAKQCLHTILMTVHRRRHQWRLACVITPVDVCIRIEQRREERDAPRGGGNAKRRAAESVGVVEAAIRGKTVG